MPRPPCLLRTLAVLAGTVLIAAGLAMPSALPTAGAAPVTATPPPVLHADGNRLVDGIAYSNDLSGWLEHKPTDPAGNLAAAWHVYNFNVCSTSSCWDAQLAPVAAEVPLVAGEIGENTCSHGFIDSVMKWLDAHQASYLGWTWNTWNCASGPALISSYDGTPTAFGAGLRDHLAALAG